MYLLSHSQADTPVKNIQLTLRTVPNLCKNDSLPVFGGNGNTYTTFTQSATHTHILHIIETLVGQKETIGTKVNTACQGNYLEYS